MADDIGQQIEALLAKVVEARLPGVVEAHLPGVVETRLGAILAHFAMIYVPPDLPAAKLDEVKEHLDAVRAIVRGESEGAA